MTNYFAHATALIESDQIGDRTRIWAYAHVLKGAVVGEDCNIGDHCFIEGGAVVGSRVTMKNSNMLWEGVTLEDGVFVGPHVFFTNDLFPRSPRLAEAAYRYQDHGWMSTTTIQTGASLGAAAVILAGTVIGAFSMVGAGAVVTKNVKPYALVIGNPARQIGWVCKCGQRLHFNDDAAASYASCACGLEYDLSFDTVTCLLHNI